MEFHDEAAYAERSESGTTNAYLVRDVVLSFTFPFGFLVRVICL